MNIKLAFTPVSLTPVDLLVFVLDDEQILHEVDDPAVRAHVQRAATQYREKTLKREYFATLPDDAPANVCTPEYMADRAAEAAKEVGLEIEILDPSGLKARGYLGCLRVGQGSAHPPRMVILRHVPRKPSKETVALVGKGITFDTGGISLKPGDHMWEMKGDMAGAAAVLYSMRALGRLAPDVKVVGILCCAENFPDANAQRPGDIFTAKNGKSIVVDNTDAEGRLVLTDGLHRAGEEGATHVVDIATLTGACLRALGPSVAGVLGTDRELIRRVIRSGENHGEAFWELPLVEEYRDALKTPYADINNIASGGLAGAIPAP